MPNRPTEKAGPMMLLLMCLFSGVLCSGGGMLVVFVGIGRTGPVTNTEETAFKMLFVVGAVLGFIIGVVGTATMLYKGRKGGD